MRGKNEINKRYGRLTVLQEDGRNKHGQILWKCRCTCGKEITTPGVNLRRGDTTSCGCYRNELSSQRSRLDISSKRFHSLVAMKPVGKDNHRQILWKCKCDCGGEIITTCARLRTGGTKSCGCKRRKYKPKESAIYRLFYDYQERAKRKEISFDFSFDQFALITSQPCFYCKQEPLNNRKVGINSYTYSGIDRVDNSKGYTVDNCVPCCKICNHAKSNMSLSKFLQWLTLITSNLDEIKKFLEPHM
jgi:hypothetical protein